MNKIEQLNKLSEAEYKTRKYAWGIDQIWRCKLSEIEKENERIEICNRFLERLWGGEVVNEW